MDPAGAFIDSYQMSQVAWKLVGTAFGSCSNALIMHASHLPITPFPLDRPPCSSSARRCWLPRPGPSPSRAPSTPTRRPRPSPAARPPFPAPAPLPRPACCAPPWSRRQFKLSWQALGSLQRGNWAAAPAWRPAGRWSAAPRPGRPPTGSAGGWRRGPISTASCSARKSLCR